MKRAASLAAVSSAAFMIVMSSAAPALVLSRGASPLSAIVPVVSSNAHRGVNGRYGGLKSRTPVPAYGNSKGRSLNGESRARKQPYPYRYYYDTSRGNYGCHRYGKRAIDTDNANWWTRYRSCTETQPEKNIEKNTETDAD
jgi:hypothetical protein